MFKSTVCPLSTAEMAQKAVKMSQCNKSLPQSRTILNNEAFFLLSLPPFWIGDVHSGQRRFPLEGNLQLHVPGGGGGGGGGHHNLPDDIYRLGPPKGSVSLPSSPLLPRQSYMLPLRPSKRSPGTVFFCFFSPSHPSLSFHDSLFAAIIILAKTKVLRKRERR